MPPEMCEKELQIGFRQQVEYFGLFLAVQHQKRRYLFHTAIYCLRL
jgi:hypothetical protein